MLTYSDQICRHLKLAALLLFFGPWCFGDHAAAGQGTSGAGNDLHGSPSLIAFDPFPADMDLWSCGAYIRALDGTSHAKTLKKILEIRPHAYWGSANREDLVKLDDDLVIKSRINNPVYLHLVHREVVSSLVGLTAAAAADGLSIRVQSAYRSPGYQNYLWKLQVRYHKSDLARAAFGVAPPCFSEHATGRAVDFTSGGLKPDFEMSPEYRWLRENAAKWGWVQSFRNDNGAVRTPDSKGVLIEAWHFHHIGLDKPAAPRAN